MPLTRRPRSASSGQPSSTTASKPCSKHSKEMIKYYCSNHNALLCNVCVTLEHVVTGCNVKYLPDIAEKTINSKEVTDTLTLIDAQIKRSKAVTETLKKLHTVSHNSLKDVLKEINKYRQEINDQLDKLEKETKEAVKMMDTNFDEEMRNAEVACGGIANSLKAFADSIKLFNTSKQAEKLFMELKTAENIVKENEQKLSKLSSTDMKQFDFKPNGTIISFLANTSNIGTIFDISKTTASIPVPQSQGGIQVKTTKDKNACWITGMILISPSTLAIADHENQSIKLVDTENQSVTNQLELNNWVWDIAMVTTDQLAVTLPDQHIIQFINISTNTLKKTTIIAVDGQCYGIDCYKDKLVVTFNYPGKLEIIGLNGDVLMTVSTDTKFEDIFKEPEYVVVNEAAIYVSDCKKQAVLKMNWKGDVVSKYRSKGAPKGLASMQDGSLLIAYYHEDNCSIQLAKSDLTNGKEVLKNLRQPHAVHWCGTTGNVYVSSHGAGEQNDNYIQIYTPQLQ